MIFKQGDRLPGGPPRRHRRLLPVLWDRQLLMSSPDVFFALESVCICEPRATFSLNPFTSCILKILFVFVFKKMSLIHIKCYTERTVTTHSSLLAYGKNVRIIKGMPASHLSTGVPQGLRAETHFLPCSHGLVLRSSFSILRSVMRVMLCDDSDMKTYKI